MALLIDGYNVLHSTGMLARNPGPGSLQRARQSLLDFLVASLSEGDRGRTTVVFDAQHPPADRQSLYSYQGVTVRFAVAYASADELIEELIKLDSAPRQLVVVSSDHRLHKAARRRRAKAIDSEQWYAGLLRDRASRPRFDEAAAKPPQAPTVTAEEIQSWADELKKDALEPIFPPEYLAKLDDEEKREQ